MGQQLETYTLDALLIVALGWWVVWCLIPPREVRPDAYHRAALSEVMDALMAGPDAPGRAALRAADEARPNPDLEKGLNEIRRRDSRFDVSYFLDSARTMYAQILRAYASGDRKALSAHVSREVLETLAARISAREERGEYTEIQIESIAVPQILDVGVTAGSAWAVVRCTGRIGSAAYDADKKRIDGHDAVQDTAEVWVFARDIGAPRTSWMLVAMSPGVLEKAS